MSQKTAFWFIEMTWNFMSLSDSLAFNITITMVNFSVGNLGKLCRSRSKSTHCLHFRVLHWVLLTDEPRHEKTGFLHNMHIMLKQSCRSAQLISNFVFVTQIVQSLLFLNPKFQASSYLLLLHSLVCVGAGQKPRRPVFSCRGSDNSKASCS